MLYNMSLGLITGHSVQMIQFDKKYLKQHVAHQLGSAQLASLPRLHVADCADCAVAPYFLLHVTDCAVAP